MVETFYAHLEFIGKNVGWSINLPFLCTKCGTCCTLENFLTAGKINDPKQAYPEVHAKFKALSEELGKLWEQDEAKYDQHIISKPCPFLVSNACTIYKIRPDGCRLFPNTTFGIQATDCPSLARFKKQRAALKKGRRCTETYCQVAVELTEYAKLAKPAAFTERQYQSCMIRLRQTGVTDAELILFNRLNGRRQ